MFKTVTLNFGSNKTVIYKKDKVNNKKKHFIGWSTKMEI